MPPHKTLWELLRALPNELLYQIIQNVLEMTPNYPITSDDTRFRSQSLQVAPLLEVEDEHIRQTLVESLAKDFAFIEVYRYPHWVTPLLGSDDTEIDEEFMRFLPHEPYDQLLSSRNAKDIQLSTLRMGLRSVVDIRSSNLIGPERPPVLLAFTKASQFAALLVSAFLQRFAYRGYHLEIELTSHSIPANNSLLGALRQIRRHLRSMGVNHFYGIPPSAAQHFIRTVSSDLTREVDYFAHRNRTLGDVVHLIRTGIPVHAMVPLLWALILGHHAEDDNKSTVFNDMNDPELVGYFDRLHMNYHDILLRGVAEFMLLSGVDASHFVMRESYRRHLAEVFFIYIAIGDFETQEFFNHLGESTLAPINITINLEILIKTQMLLALALSRMLIGGNAVGSYFAGHYGGFNAIEIGADLLRQSTAHTPEVRSGTPGEAPSRDRRSFVWLRQVMAITRALQQVFRTGDRTPIMGPMFYDNSLSPGTDVDTLVASMDEFRLIYEITEDERRSIHERLQSRYPDMDWV